MSRFERSSVWRFKYLGRAAAWLPVAGILGALAAAIFSRGPLPVPQLGPWLLTLVAVPLAVVLGAGAQLSHPVLGDLLEALEAIPPVLLAGPALLFGVGAPDLTLAVGAVVLIAPRVYRATQDAARGGLEAGLALGIAPAINLRQVWAPMVGPALASATLRGLARTLGLAAPLVALGHSELLAASVTTGPAPHRAAAVLALLLCVLALEVLALRLEVRP